MARKTELEIKNDIEQLQKAADDIFKAAALKGRTLTDEEHALRGEIIEKIDELRGELALFEAPKPVTQPGPRGLKGPSSMSDTFKNNGEYFQAVARSMTPGNPLDHRLIKAAGGLGSTITVKSG